MCWHRLWCWLYPGNHKLLIPRDLCFFFLVRDDPRSCGPIYFGLKGDWRMKSSQPSCFAELWYRPFSSPYPFGGSLVGCHSLPALCHGKLREAHKRAPENGMTASNIDGEAVIEGINDHAGLYVGWNTDRTTIPFSSLSWVQHSQFTQNKELSKAAAMVRFNREITQDLCLVYTYALCTCSHGISTERTRSG